MTKILVKLISIKTSERSSFIADTLLKILRRPEELKATLLKLGKKQRN